MKLKCCQHLDRDAIAMVDGYSFCRECTLRRCPPEPKTAIGRLLKRAT